MTVWIVWHGDGYGHNSIEAVYSNEKAATAHAEKAGGEESGYSTDDYEVKPWPEGICGSCGHDAIAHNPPPSSGCFCGCTTFIQFPLPSGTGTYPYDKDGNFVP